ncbi:hypothetical protein N7478_003770 [Penicillium angulare]|uniref:uncharacterized protein n=1 Tax=Penicillium angulare TaxID=116970 RepID=UPI0025406932|nr:uncharacterized protein N7478_003770 [Penicillium angulare]KAJ5288084.1 hypothetical protein N7478_003770 [Penicillium angulare]
MADTEHPCSLTIRTKNLEILQILHSTSKVDYNWKDDRGQTPLICALSRNRSSIGLCLLKWHCSDLATHDHKGRSALWYAVYFGNETLVTEILRRGGDMKRSDCKGIPPLILAIYKNHLPIVNAMLRIAGSARGLNLVDDFAMSKPLSLALHLGRLDIAQCLLSYGADPNGSDVYGEAALQITIRKDDKKAVVMLLQQAGLEVNAANAAGETALHIAAYYGRDEIFRLLLAVSGQDHDLKTHLGCTALHVAAEMDRECIVKQLLEVPNIDLNARDNNGSTPLSLTNNSRIRLRFLLEKRIDVNDDGVYRSSALHRAIEQKDVASVSLLLAEPRLNPNVYDDMGWTPLCQAAYHGDLQMVDLLLGRADVEVNTPMCPPLFYAAREAHLAVVKRLIKVESIIVDVKFCGQSPIQAAVQSGHAEIVRVLGRKQRLMQSDMRSA